MFTYAYNINCLYICLDVHCQLCCLSLFFLDFTIFLHMLAFNNNSIASFNWSMISYVLLIVHTRNEHLQGHLIVWFGSGDLCIYFMFQYDYLACSCSLPGIHPICSLPCVLCFLCVCTIISHLRVFLEYLTLLAYALKLSYCLLLV